MKQLLPISLFVLLIANCDLTQNPCIGTYAVKDYNHQVIAFYPHYRYRVLPIATIPFDKLTRIVYAFANVTPEGNIDTSDLRHLDDLIEAAHDKGVEVYVSVGGANSGRHFLTIAKNNRARTNCVRQLRDYALRHCIDGIDIDWEYWTPNAKDAPLPADKKAFTTFIKALHRALNPYDLKISIDVFASHRGGQLVADALEPLVDQVHIMAYDFTGTWSKAGPHASFEQSIGQGDKRNATGLAYWAHYRQWDKSKLCLGIPFYGRDFSRRRRGRGITYRDISKRYRDAHKVNRAGRIYYNGHPLIRKKARHVKEHDYGGVMIWELGQDTRDDKSLLGVIDEVLNGF